jgi:hypothetical protein
MLKPRISNKPKQGPGHTSERTSESLTKQCNGQTHLVDPTVACCGDFIKAGNRDLSSVDPGKEVNQLSVALLCRVFHGLCSSRKLGNALGTSSEHNDHLACLEQSPTDIDLSIPKQWEQSSKVIGVGVELIQEE